MINYIIVDDNKEITKIIKEIIDKTMMKNKYEYKIHIFNDYDKEFFNMMDKKLNNKIYFLDIETRSASGIDIARKIRKDDLESILIFITAHEELGGTIIKEQLMALTFICKFDDFSKRIKEAINKSLLIIGKQQKIKINDNGALYVISMKDILYVIHDNVERKCIIKTNSSKYKISKTLTEIKELANGNLVQAHRACLVNEDRIVKFDKKNRIIFFDNGESIDLVSNNYKKEGLK